MKVTGKLTKTEWLLLLMTMVFLCMLVGLGRSMPPPVEGDGYSVLTSRSTEEMVTPEPTPPVDVNTAGVDELDTLDGIGPALAQRIIDYREEHGPFSSLEELDTLHGIGPALAQRIIDYREENGPFSSLEDLLEVKGIGETTLEGFRDHAVAGTGG